MIDLSQVKVLSNMLNLSESTLQEVFCSITITITSLAAPRVIISTSFPWLLSRDLDLRAMETMPPSSWLVLMGSGH